MAATAATAATPAAAAAVAARPAAAPDAELSDPREATAERRLVSVLFTDLVGFTTLAEDRDPEAVRELLSRYFDAATQAITLHGGTVEKFIGDAVMAVWGTPVAHEDDAERAVRAALELVDAVAQLHPGLRARSGVLTGEAAVTIGATNQGMVAGDLVNTAARLQGVAEAGTVLVGEATRRAAERAIVFEPLGEHSLKGKTSPVPAWRALRVVAQRGGQGRTDALEPPFVGRDEELRQLKDVLHAVGRERRPRLVSITGPGGIGKSRLVWELEKYIDGVSEDIYWHRGRSPSYGEGITFWALGEMVRRRTGLTEDADEPTTRAQVAATLEEYVTDPSERDRIGPALLSLLGVDEAPPGGRDKLFPAWRTFFERVAERGTTVMVFEDLQWADSGLLDFIDHLLDWSRGLPIMVVTLARPELFDRRPDWAAGRRQLTALALEPLSDDAVRALLEGLVPGLPADAMAAIAGRAEGVPLYAVETVRGLLADGLIERQDEVYAVVGDVSRLRVPESLRSLIASRLDGLEAEDRALVQDAAVLGQVFSAEALAGVTGIESDAVQARLRALVRRELFDVETDPRSPERGQYRFVQSLIREVAYGTLARRDRRARHLAVARHYEAGGDEELVGALASHYVAAHEASDEGPEADAIATQARLALGAAAGRAAALGAHRQAVAHVEQALTVTSSTPERAALLDRAASSAALAAMPEAEGYAEQALEAYRETGDTAAVAAATARLGRVLLDASRLGDATAVLEAAVPDAGALDDPSADAALHAQLARAYMRLGRNEESVNAADRALVIAERRNLEDVAAEALLNKASALAGLGRRREGLAIMAGAVQLAAELEDRSMELRARNNYASSLSDDDPLGARRELEEAIEIASDIGDHGMYFWMVSAKGFNVRAEGEGWDECRAATQEAFDAAMLPLDRVRLRAVMTLLDAARGELLDDADAAVLEIVGDSTEPEAQFFLALTRAETAIARGDHETAYRHALDAAAINMQDEVIPLEAAFQAAVASHSAERMVEVARRIDAKPYSGRFSEAQRSGLRGSVAATEGRAGDAVVAIRSAVGELSALGQRYEAARVAVNAVTLLRDQPELRALALEQRPLLEELRARPLLARLDAALAGPTSSGAARDSALAEVEAE